MARRNDDPSYLNSVAHALEELGGEARLPHIYEYLRKSDDLVQRRIEQGKDWKTAVRVRLSGNADGRGHDIFRSAGTGWWRLKGGPVSDKMVVREIRKTLRMLDKVKEIELNRIELESHIEDRGRESRDLRFVYRIKS